jgi:hypothetical protein
MCNCGRCPSCLAAMRHQDHLHIREIDMQPENTYRKCKLIVTAEITLRPENYKYDEFGNVRDGWEDLTPEEMVELERDLLVEGYNDIQDYMADADGDDVKLELISDETSCAA